MSFLLCCRVFGHFEKPLFFELCKHIITKTLPKGKILFRPGPVRKLLTNVYYALLLFNAI